MASYRRYYLDGKGVVFYADIIEAASDDDAIVAAAATLEEKTYACAIEVWSRRRRVKTVIRR